MVIKPYDEHVDSRSQHTLIFSEVPVTRRGKILPRSEIKRFNNSVSL